MNNVHRIITVGLAICRFVLGAYDDAPVSAVRTVTSSPTTPSTSSLSRMATPIGNSNLTIEELALSLRNRFDTPTETKSSCNNHGLIFRQPAAIRDSSRSPPRSISVSTTILTQTIYTFLEPVPVGGVIMSFSTRAYSVLGVDTAARVVSTGPSTAPSQGSISTDFATTTAVPGARTGTNEILPSFSPWEGPNPVAARVGIYGASATVPAAESSGAPRVRPKAILIWSLVLVAASTAFSRTAKSRWPSETDAEVTSTTTSRLWTSPAPSLFRKGKRKKSAPVSALASKSRRRPPRRDANGGSSAAGAA